MPTRCPPFEQPDRQKAFGATARYQAGARLFANLHALSNPTITVPDRLCPSPIAGRCHINWSRSVIVARCRRRPDNGPNGKAAKHTSGYPPTIGSGMSRDKGRADYCARRQCDHSIHVRLHKLGRLDDACGRLKIGEELGRGIRRCRGADQLPCGSRRPPGTHWVIGA